MTAAGRRSRALRRRPWLILFGVLLLAFVAWFLYLDLTVTRKFDGRRWDLPAQVYARPLELYAGLALRRESLEQELGRLGYRKIGSRPTRPGEFSASQHAVELKTRAFRFWDQEQDAQLLRVDFAAGRIARLTDGRANVPIARVDPLLMGSIFPTHGEDRLVVSPEETPALLEAALKVVEDRRFDSHYGVDPRALFRAIFVNLRSGELVQGGSTLTQQLVKNYFLDNRRSLWRKIREAAMALILELHYEKDDLLNAYVNEIYMGQDGSRAIHGFGLASQYYFSRPLAELETHQLALLVALVKGPTYYDPWRHPERARERRDLVLQLMAGGEVISPAESQSAAAQSLDTWDREASGVSYYPAYLQRVRAQLADQYRDEDLTSTGLRVFTALDPGVQATAEARLADGLVRLDRRDGAAAVKLSGAVVVIDAKSGEATAIVGDRRSGYEGFNRALDARRPVGSLVKPAVYLAALQAKRHTLASTIADEPLAVTLENGDTWSPGNYSGETHGEVTLLRALAESFNLATVRVGLDVGVRGVADTLIALGAPDDIDAFPSLLLGSVELTPLEVAQIYGTLANIGFRMPVRAVRSVVDSQGQPLERYPMAIEQVTDPAATFQLNQALVEVMQRGTGRSALGILPSDLVVAGKTGTSDEYRDSWFAGFSGDHVMVVWVGYDDNRPTGLTGASGALMIWSSIMKELRGASYAAPLPARLENRWIEYETGLMARPDCADVVELALPPDLRLGAKPGCAPRRGLFRWLDEVFN
ncbi:MAG: penicillin-binding protein 1B [Gammaproteobacteria bacterium]|nr:penicillin-binding protein 1B [Gammaproteobacteria bacterium]